MLIEQVPVTLAAPVSDTPRTPGVHVSKAIRAIAQLNGVLERVTEDPSLVESEGDTAGWWATLSEEAKIRISMGLAWEVLYLGQLENVVAHPGEMTLDRIHMTPDGESVSYIHTERIRGHVVAIHEVKLTYKSINTVGDFSTQYLWTAQTKSYCKARKTRFCYVHVLYVCGDYKYPITPKLVCYRIEYTQDEIDENWDIIRSFVEQSLQPQEDQ